MPKNKLSPVTKRLRPLYIAAFLQGIPFWYAIEKLFMVEIGFNTASIGLMVAIMSVVMLVVETPSGILADRWSRKGVMMLGCLSLLASAVVGALSYNEVVFIISTIFWGIYAAFYSGTYDSVIYDTLEEESGNSTKFESYLGNFRAIEGLSYAIGALSGGVIASQLGMRSTFLVSIPALIVALYFLYIFKEPKLHKSTISEPILKHIRQTFAAVLKSPSLLPIVISTVGFGILLEVLFELNQLWYIAIATPIALFGIASAAVYSSVSTGGLLAPKLSSKKASVEVMMTIFIALVVLILSRDFWVILSAQVLLSVCLITLGVILSKKLHDQLPSRLRAGSASVVSTISRTILIPGSILFTLIADRTSVFNATYLLLGVAIISIAAYLSVKQHTITRPT